MTVLGFHLFSWGQQVSGNMLSTENRSSPDSAPHVLCVILIITWGGDKTLYRERRRAIAMRGQLSVPGSAYLLSFIYPVIHLSICPSICPSIRLSIHPFIRTLFIHSSIHPSIHPPAPIHPSIYISGSLQSPLLGLLCSYQLGSEMISVIQPRKNMILVLNAQEGVLAQLSKQSFSA